MVFEGAKLQKKVVIMCLIAVFFLFFVIFLSKIVDCSKKIPIFAEIIHLNV